MKRPGLTQHLVSATLFLGLVATLRAQENIATPADRAAKRNAELLKRFDTNADGKLDDDERAAAKETMMKEQMTRATVVPGGPEAFRARMLELFDKNKDGRLDDEERAEAQKFAAERGFNPNGELSDELLKRFDVNGNGRIDDDERAALQAFVKARMNQGLNGEAGEKALLVAALRSAVEANPVQLQRFDADKDGKLSDSEWAVARKAILGALYEPADVRSGNVEEQKRLTAVAAEVARRRKLREEASGNLEKKK